MPEDRESGPLAPGLEEQNTYTIGPISSTHRPPTSDCPTVFKSQSFLTAAAVPKKIEP
jgi:hypothetical protein